MMSPMSYQGMKRTHDNNIMVYRCRLPWWSLRHDKGVSNVKSVLSADLSLVSMKP